MDIIGRIRGAIQAIRAYFTPLLTGLKVRLLNIALRTTMLFVALWHSTSGSLVNMALGFVVLVCAVVIGLYIVSQIESSMISSGFNNSSSWWTPYQNFVNIMQSAFPILGVAALISVLLYLLVYLIRSFRQGA